MKIDIGPYPRDLIRINRWERLYNNRRGNLTEDNYLWYDKVIYRLFDVLDIAFEPINRVSRNRKRKIKIKVDGFDVWGADHTIALIVAPILVELRDQQNGIPSVSNEDVPPNLHYESNDGGYDAVMEDLGEQRWKFVLGEMIWTFTELAKDGEGEDQFRHNSDQLELVYNDSKLDNAKTLTFNHQKDPDKLKYWVDDVGLSEYRKRKENGLQLFAKYYGALWN